MPSRRLSILLAAASLLALVGAGCASNTDTGLNARGDGNLEKTDTIPAQGTSATNAPNAPAPASAPAAVSFSINASDASATPETITVAKGASVTITFNVNQTGTYHGGLDFRSDVVNSGTVATGTSKSVTFTADHSFSFQPYWPSTSIAKPYKISVIVQ